MNICKPLFVAHTRPTAICTHPLLNCNKLSACTSLGFYAMACFLSYTYHTAHAGGSHHNYPCESERLCVRLSFTFYENPGITFLYSNLSSLAFPLVLGTTTYPISSLLSSKTSKAFRFLARAAALRPCMYIYSDTCVRANRYGYRSISSSCFLKLR
jgi:hypothetical protein